MDYIPEDDSYWQVSNGMHEVQESDCVEADLQTDFKTCTKNYGHTKFIPVNDFNFGNLPEGYHDTDLLKYINAVADLTVRVAVNFISPERPQFCTESYNPYPFYDTKKRDVTRTGTGSVCHVKQYTDDYNKKRNLGTCKCYKCRFSSKPRPWWGEIWVHTARHVVFDDLEARHATCRLFFDREDSPVVILDGWQMIEGDLEKDWCGMKCYTCDVDLLVKLETMVRNYHKMCFKVSTKYTHEKRKADTLIFIVSHPHGCPKQVSIGRWINKNLVGENGETNYTYTTCTCPGSSGAYVNSLWNTQGLLFSKHIHTGVNANGINVSGIGYTIV